MAYKSIHKFQMRIFRLVFITIAWLGINHYSMAQDVLVDVSATLKAGSSRELVKFCNDVVELKIDGESSNYSRTQAEFILKDFFKKNEASGFEYVFEGNSREGLKYAIGTYSYKGGSYRVYILFKKAGDALMIDTLDFTKE